MLPLLGDVRSALCFSLRCLTLKLGWSRAPNFRSCAIRLPLSMMVAAADHDVNAHERASRHTCIYARDHVVPPHIALSCTSSPELVSSNTVLQGMLVLQLCVDSPGCKLARPACGQPTSLCTIRILPQNPVRRHHPPSKQRPQRGERMRVVLDKAVDLMPQKRVPAGLSYDLCLQRAKASLVLPRATAAGWYKCATCARAQTTSMSTHVLR